MDMILTAPASYRLRYSVSLTDLVHSHVKGSGILDIEESGHRLRMKFATKDMIPFDLIYDGQSTFMIEGGIHNALNTSGMVFNGAPIALYFPFSYNSMQTLKPLVGPYAKGKELGFNVGVVLRDRESRAFVAGGQLDWTRKGAQYATLAVGPKGFPLSLFAYSHPTSLGTFIVPGTIRFTEQDQHVQGGVAVSSRAIKRYDLRLTKASLEPSPASDFDKTRLLSTGMIVEDNGPLGQAAFQYHPGASYTDQVSHALGYSSKNPHEGTLNSGQKASLLTLIATVGFAALAAVLLVLGLRKHAA